MTIHISSKHNVLILSKFLFYKLSIQKPTYKGTINTPKLLNSKHEIPTNKSNFSKQPDSTSSCNKEIIIWNFW